MHSAIGSRKDFNNLDEDQLLAEYKVCLEGLPFYFFVILIIARSPQNVY